MPENFPVDTSPLLVAASLQSRKQILVGAGSTIYYKSDRTVSPSSNDGSIALGGSLPLTDNTWIASGSQSRIVVTDLEGTIAPGTGAGRTDTSGVFHDVDLRLYGEVDTLGVRGASTLINKALADIALKGGATKPTSLAFGAGTYLLDAPLSNLSTASFTLKTAGRSSTKFKIAAGASFNTFFKITASDVTIEPCFLQSLNTPVLAGGHVPKGTWNASTNKVNNGANGIFDGIGTLGDTYFVEVGAAHDFGHGSITFTTGDYVYYDGSLWKRMASPYGIIVDGCSRARVDVRCDGIGGIELGPSALAVGPEITTRGTWNADFGLPGIMGWKHSGVRMDGNFVGAGSLVTPKCGMHEINALDGIDGGHWNVAMQYVPSGGNGGYWYGLKHDGSRNKIVNQDHSLSTYDHWVLAGQYIKNNGGTEEYRYNRCPKRLTADTAQANARPVGVLVCFNGSGSPLEANHYDGKAIIIGGGARAFAISDQNHVNFIQVSAQSGTFTITVPLTTLGAQSTTAAINFDAFADTAYGDANAAATVQAKLEALPNVGTGNVRVFGGTGAPGAQAVPYIIIWCGALSGQVTTSSVTASGAGLTLAAGDTGVTVTSELDTSSTAAIRDFKVVGTSITGNVSGASTPHREALVSVMSNGVSLVGNSFASSGADNVARVLHFVEVLTNAGTADFSNYTFVGNKATLESTFARIDGTTGSRLTTQAIVGNSPSDSDRLTFKEIADPIAPEADAVELYAKDNGAGKTLLVARFSSGAVQTIATQP